MSKPKKQNQQMKMALLFMGLFMLFIMFNMMAKQQQEQAVLSFSEFMEAVNLPSSDVNRIIEVTFKENEILALRTDNSSVRVFAPHDADLRKVLLEKKVQVSYEPPEEGGVWKTLLVNSLPMLLLLFLFFFFMRQLQIGGGKAMSFGKSRAKLLNENQAKVTFNDVVLFSASFHVLVPKIKEGDILIKRANEIRCIL